MTIYCDIDGVLRTYMKDWKAFKHFMNYREYLTKAAPIKENIETILKLSEEHDVKLATCCQYQLLNEIWLQEYDIHLPFIITAKDKVPYLAERFEIKGSCLIDDKISHIRKAEEYGMHGIYVPTNSVTSLRNKFRQPR